MRTADILVVEDDADIRSALCSTLEHQGYVVRAVPDGMQALLRLRDGERPAMILLDLVMPVMNGAEFRSAQLADPTLASIPVVVLSADRRLRELAAELGAAAALAKPFVLRELLQAISSTIGGDRSPRAYA